MRSTVLVAKALAFLVFSFGLLGCTATPGSIIKKNGFIENRPVQDPAVFEPGAIYSDSLGQRVIGRPSDLRLLTSNTALEKYVTNFAAGGNADFVLAKFGGLRLGGTAELITSVELDFGQVQLVEIGSNDLRLVADGDYAQIYQEIATSNAGTSRSIIGKMLVAENMCFTMTTNNSVELQAKLAASNAIFAGGIQIGPNKNTVTFKPTSKVVIAYAPVPREEIKPLCKEIAADFQVTMASRLTAKDGDLQGPANPAQSRISPHLQLIQNGKPIGNPTPGPAETIGNNQRGGTLQRVEEHIQGTFHRGDQVQLKVTAKVGGKLHEGTVSVNLNSSQRYTLIIAPEKDRMGKDDSYGEVACDLILAVTRTSDSK